jgi:hypothetical protein
MAAVKHLNLENGVFSIARAGPAAEVEEIR